MKPVQKRAKAGVCWIQPRLKPISAACSTKIPCFLSLKTKSPKGYNHQPFENTTFPALKLEALRFGESPRLNPTPRESLSPPAMAARMPPHTGFIPKGTEKWVFGEVYLPPLQAPASEFRALVKDPCVQLRFTSRTLGSRATSSPGAGRVNGDGPPNISRNPDSVILTASREEAGARLPGTSDTMKQPEVPADSTHRHLVGANAPGGASRAGAANRLPD